jgi:hypothetical protein
MSDVDPKNGHDPVSCERAYRLLFELLEGTLPETMSQSVLEHFHGCPPCLEFFDSYRKTPGLAREALAKEVPTEVTNVLVSFLREKLPQD